MKTAPRIPTNAVVLKTSPRRTATTVRLPQLSYPKHGFNVGFDGMLEKQKAAELKIAHCLTESSLTAGHGERAIQPQK